MDQGADARLGWGSVNLSGTLITQWMLGWGWGGLGWVGVEQQLQEGFLGEESVGEKYMGEKYV